MSAVVAILFLVIATLNYCFPLNIPTGADSYSTVVLAKDGQTLRAFADKNGMWRQRVKLQDVSPLYIEALLSYEDQYFWYHPGVNPFALIRAFWLNWQHGKIISGGSTLSMQVARILHPHSRTFSGKLYQMVRTFQLELLLSKQDILELYLNFAPFGGTIEGVEAASQAYLDKSSSELTHAEAALLAVLPQRPSNIRPDRYPDLAKKARDKVLKRLKLLSVWLPETVTAAMVEDVIADKPDKPLHAPLYTRFLKNRFAQQQRIHSTVDYHLQIGLEALLKSHVDRSPNGSSGAIVVIDNQNQEVIAWLGSADFNNKSRFGHVDMVRAIRSPGSTLKPFVYGLAIDNGLIHTHSLLSDVPRIHSQYKPSNFNGRFSGPVTVKTALQQSLNVPAVQVLEQLGPAELYNRLGSAGIKLNLPVAGRPNLSLALGGAGTNLWQLVQAYASFANQGKVVKPALTVDSKSFQSKSLQSKSLHGKSLQSNSLHGKPGQNNSLQSNSLQRNAPQSNSLQSNARQRHLMSPQAAWLTYKMLVDNPRPDSIGSASIVERPNNIAWKTGTSFGFRDAWAIGVSQSYTIGVWLGRPDGTPQPGHYGALNAAPLLYSISDRLHRSVSATIKAPQGVEKSDICWPLGNKMNNNEMKNNKMKSNEMYTQPNPVCHQVHQAWLIDGIAPPTLNLQKEEDWQVNPVTIWLDNSNGKRADSACEIENKKSKLIALWPIELETWIEPKYARRNIIPPKSENCENAPDISFGGVKITGGTHITKSSDKARFLLLDNQESLALSFGSQGGGGDRHWYINGHHIQTLPSNMSFRHQFNEKGHHQVLVIDETGATDKIEFDVLLKQGGK